MSFLCQGLVAAPDDSGLQDEENFSSWRMFRTTKDYRPLAQNCQHFSSTENYTTRPVIYFSVLLCVSVAPLKAVTNFIQRN